jgi:hypothetical protein
MKMIHHYAVEQALILKESANQAFEARNYRKAVDVRILLLPIHIVASSFESPVVVY